MTQKIFCECTNLSLRDQGFANGNAVMWFYSEISNRHISDKNPKESFKVPLPPQIYSKVLFHWKYLGFSIPVYTREKCFAFFFFLILLFYYLETSQADSLPNTIYFFTFTSVYYIINLIENWGTLLCHWNNLCKVLIKHHALPLVQTESWDQKSCLPLCF